MTARPSVRPAARPATKPARRQVRGARPNKPRVRFAVYMELARLALQRATLLLLVTALGLAFWQGARWLAEMPVERVVFEGDIRHSDRDALVAAVNRELPAGFLGLDLQKLRETLEQEDWVYQVSIRRQWPKTLAVQVQEETPIARWGQGGVLNHRGEIFNPGAVALDADLPLLSGPAERANDIMTVYQSLRDGMKGVGLELTKLELTDRGSWLAVTGQGMDIWLGRESPARQLQRFLMVFEQKLQGQADAIARVDMRYVNGVAVAFRDGRMPENAAIKNEDQRQLAEKANG